MTKLFLSMLTLSLMCPNVVLLISSTDRNKRSSNTHDPFFFTRVATTFGRATKDFPIVYKPLPMILGTKKELLLLQKNLRLPLNLSSYIKEDMPDNELLSIPFNASQLVRSNRPLGFGLVSSKPRNEICVYRVEELVSALKSPRFAALVHESPELVITILRVLSGPKSNGKRPALRSSYDPSPDIETLVWLALENRALIKTIVKFAPRFFTDLTSALLDDEHWSQVAVIE